MFMFRMLQISGQSSRSCSNTCDTSAIVSWTLIIIRKQSNSSSSNSPRITKPPSMKAKPDDGALRNAILPVQVVLAKKQTIARSMLISSSTGLMSTLPPSVPSASNVFGIGSEHPFSNYWTCQGGLAEVISVLPEKIQADILLERYFEIVDGVYPMIHRQTFYADFEHFWSRKFSSG